MTLGVDEQIANIVILLVLLLLSAFFSSSEAAFLSLQKTRIAHLVHLGVAGAERVSKMIDEPDRLLSTILLGNNLVNVGFAAVITVITIALIGDSNRGLGVMLATTVATAVLLVFGEVIPKTIAVRHAEKISLVYARPIALVEKLLFPLVLLLRIVGSLFEQRKTKSQQLVTEAELRSLIDIGEAEGSLETEEAAMLEGVFRFGDRKVREVMTPRTEMAFVQRGDTLGEFLKTYAQNTHTRFPVYKDSTDNIVGVLSAKDILSAMASRNLNLDDSVTDVIRDAYFIPETKRIAELFDQLRESGNQMAIAIDEYGGIAGLVTLKSLLEEVVGRVGEEGEVPEEEYEEIGENRFQIDGGMSIGEVKEEIGIELPDGDYETISGFVLEVLGHIPVLGEQFEYGSWKVEVTDVEGVKIKEVRMTRVS